MALFLLYARLYEHVWEQSRPQNDTVAFIGPGQTDPKSEKRNLIFLFPTQGEECTEVTDCTYLFC